ncbi:MAG: CocE/NonD family hydrolase, partial [Pseudomonadota bacterium]
MKRCLALILLCASTLAHAADLPYAGAQDPAALAQLARDTIAQYKDDNRERYLNNLFRLQMVAGDYGAMLATLAMLRTEMAKTDAENAPVAYIQYELYAQAMQHKDQPFDAAYADAFRARLSRLDDVTAVTMSTGFVFDLGRAKADMERALAPQKGKDSISVDAAIALLRNVQPYQAFAAILPTTPALLNEDDARRFQIDDSVMIKVKDATLSAVVARPRGTSKPLPAALYFTIYPNLATTRYQAKYAAAHGYVGLAVDARGKRLSTDKVEPYEREVDDVNGVIDWASRQPWSDGRVATYGGSYSGFVQWAAAKHLHPAHKVMATYVSAIPGLGLPMENNVFLNANYGWAAYVGNNHMLDESIYYDRQHWNDTQEKWFASGTRYREYDSIEGHPNWMLQRWLQHPAYDKYWQAMTSYKQDFAHINIPVLSITGYYDDGQISALHYFREHMKYNPKADHYFVIGPWDHFGSQARRKPAVVNEYTVDAAAQVDTPALTFAWFDHVLRGAPMPALLKDRVNYEVMGANTWRHAPSINKMHDKVLTLYLGNGTLSEKKSASCDLKQTIDFKDRKVQTGEYYPYPVIGKKLDPALGLKFVSAPFDAPVSVNGVFEGALKAVINKRDMDVSATLYEVMPDERLFQLSYFLGRASYAPDMETRHLLTPGKVAAISFSRSRMFSRQLSKGSRLMVVIDVNKNSAAQLNYGTGRDVSDESIADAGEPLKVTWQCDSLV